MAHRVTQEYTRVDGGASNIKVSIRARPPEDKSAVTDFLQITKGEEEETATRILIKNPNPSTKKHAEVAYQFDNIFWTDAEQDVVFKETCKFQIDHVMEGYNCCCFACKLMKSL